MAALIEFRSVCKYYQMGDETVVAADHISFQIQRGEFVAIVGKSGSGKSTCMNIIGCLDVPTCGHLSAGRAWTWATMNDNQLAEIRNKMLGFIFQQYNLLPKLNVLENVELPLLYAGVSAGRAAGAGPDAPWSGWGWRTSCKNLPSQLSGGQQQRVSIARALAGKPSVILADEPTGALDSRTGREVLGLLQKLNAEGRHGGAHHPRQLHRRPGPADHPPGGRAGRLRRPRPRPRRPWSRQGPPSGRGGGAP